MLRKEQFSNMWMDSDSAFEKVTDFTVELSHCSILYQHKQHSI